MQIWPIEFDLIPNYTSFEDKFLGPERLEDNLRFKTTVEMSGSK